MKPYRPAISRIGVVARLACAAALLALAGSLAALCVRSHYTADRCRWVADTRHWHNVVSYRGVVLLQRVWHDCDIPLDEPTTFDSDQVQPENGYRDYGDSLDSIFWRHGGWLGFAYSVEPYFEGIIYCVVVPYWFLITVCLAPVAWMGTGYVRRRFKRHRPGLCGQCGYDLRAHSPGERCPECGTAIRAEAATMDSSNGSRL